MGYERASSSRMREQLLRELLLVVFSRGEDRLSPTLNRAEVANQSDGEDDPGVSGTSGAVRRTTSVYSLQCHDLLCKDAKLVV
jgi:hypothetical protein